MIEALGIILLWPFILFTVGLAAISLSEFEYASGVGIWFWAILLLIVIWLAMRARRSDANQSMAMQLEDVRKFLVGGSLVLLLPIFARYLIESFGSVPLPGIVAGTLTGFGAIIFGMAIKDNHVVSRSSMLGGVMTMLYVLSKVSLLDETSRVVATALGLLLAIVVAVVKFRERLT